MAKYVDGFVLPLKKKSIPAYCVVARKMAKLCKQYGALMFCECAGDDLKAKMGISFPKLVKAKAGETVLFSFIVYKSRAHRDRVMKKVMADPRFAKIMAGGEMPCDIERMSCGGFKTVVDM
ncbi:DUF1428 domain-containing protein [soil metagenome]